MKFRFDAEAPSGCCIRAFDNKLAWAFHVERKMRRTVRWLRARCGRSRPHRGGAEGQRHGSGALTSVDATMQTNSFLGYLPLPGSECRRPRPVCGESVVKLARIVDGKATFQLGTPVLLRASSSAAWAASWIAIHV